MSRRWVLLGALLLASGCPGSAKTFRRDAGARLDGEVLPTPLTPRAADGGAPAPLADTQPLATPQLQPDSQPPAPPPPPATPACGAVDAPCGTGQPACCAGGLCVNFGTTVSCGKVCTANSQCAENCCMATTGGTSVCAPSSLCPAPPQNPPPQDPPPQNPPPQNPPNGGSCNGSCGGPSGDCYCDYFCLAYGDCCPDVYLCWF